jgi:hypothetical protein
MDNSFTIKGLTRLGLNPKIEGDIYSVTLPNGVKLSVSSAPLFDPFFFLVLNVKKLYPDVLTEKVYFYPPLTTGSVGDTTEKVEVVIDDNLDKLLSGYNASLVIKGSGGVS